MSALAGTLVDGLAAALRADEGVAALAGERVYAEPFAGAVFPHVLLGPWKARPWHADAHRGAEVTFAVQAVSRKGRVEAMALAEACVAALEPGSVALTGARLVGVTFLDLEAVQAKGGEAWRATARFRALIEVG